MELVEHKFFPTQINLIHSGESFVEEAAYISNLKSNFNYREGAGGLQGDIDLFSPELDKVLTTIVKTITEVYKKPLRILEAWASILVKGDYNKIHNHPAINPQYYNTPIKIGVIYLQTNNEGGLTIHSPYNVTDTVDISTNAGDIVLTDSYVYHSVQPTKSENERICIAFNFILL